MHTSAEVPLLLCMKVEEDGVVFDFGPSMIYAPLERLQGLQHM